MKKESTGKKSLLWLWITIGVVALLAVGVVVFLALGNNDKNEPGQEAPVQEAKPELYWNLDRSQMIEEGTGLSMREPAEDGKYYIRFAVGGKVVELPCADKMLVNRIDQEDMVCLKLDGNNTIVEMVDLEEIYTKLADKVYVQNISGNELLLNTSQALNGMQITLKVQETKGFDLSHLAGTPGEVRTLEIMDQITIYGTDEETPTHIFVMDRWWESNVYWRASTAMQKNGVSTRPQAEDGYWYMDWATNGERVTLRTNRQDVINAWECYPNNAAYCGQVFDENGDVIDCFSGVMALRGVLKIAQWNIVELSEDGKTFTAECKMVGNPDQGETVTITIDDDCDIYNAGSAADNFRGERTDKLQLGDRIIVLCDTMDNPEIIFVAYRYVDSAMYYNLDRQWSEEEQKSLRTPDADGWYHFRLLESDKVVNYRTKDTAVVEKLDSYIRNMFALKIDGDVIIRSYDPNCVCGGNSWGFQNVVDAIEGPVVTAVNGETYLTASLAADCEVYDVSGGNPGEGTLRVGDTFVSYANTMGELTHVYITKRG